MKNQQLKHHILLHSISVSERVGSIVLGQYTGIVCFAKEYYDEFKVIYRGDIDTAPEINMFQSLLMVLLYAPVHDASYIPYNKYSICFFENDQIVVSDDSVLHDLKSCLHVFSMNN